MSKYIFIISVVDVFHEHLLTTLLHCILLHWVTQEEGVLQSSSRSWVSAPYAYVLLRLSPLISFLQKVKHLRKNTLLNLLSACLCPEPFRWWLLLLYSLLSSEDRALFATLLGSMHPWGPCNLTSSGGGSGGGGKSTQRHGGTTMCDEFLI